MSGNKKADGLFDITAYDPCWKIQCGGNCIDCGLRERRVHHFDAHGF